MPRTKKVNPLLVDDKDTTPAVEPDATVTPDVTSESSPIETANPVVETEALLPEGLAYIPLGSIVKGDNIREASKAEKVDDILNSIKVNGLQVPLTVTPARLLLDGYRRYGVLSKINNQDDLVPVLVKDIPLNMISLFQFQTMKRANIGTSEIHKAIVQFKLLNSFETNKNIAAKFDVDAATVSKALQILTASAELNTLVLENKVSQNAACKIVDSITKDASLQKYSPSTAKKKAQQRIDEVVQYIAEEVEDIQNEATTEKPFKAFNLNKINKILTAREEAPITIDPPEPRVSGVVPVKRQALSYLDKLLSVIVFSPSDTPGTLNLNGSISEETYKEICTFLTAQQIEQSTNTVVEEREIDDLRAYYEDHQDNQDAETFIQTESGYVTFNTTLADNYPALKLIVTNENSEEMIRVSTEEVLDRVIKKLNTKGISTLVVKQLRYSGLKPASTTLHAPDEDDNDPLVGIPKVDVTASDPATMTDAELTEAEEKARADIFPAESTPDNKTLGEIWKEKHSQSATKSPLELFKDLVATDEDIMNIGDDDDISNEDDY